jgi:hypothetical protein
VKDFYELIAVTKNSVVDFSDVVKIVEYVVVVSPN